MGSQNKQTNYRSETISSPKLHTQEYIAEEEVGSQNMRRFGGTRIKSIIVPKLHWLLLQIMRISKQYLHQPLKKMIARGYVNQQPDAGDRRIKRIQLTGKGKQLEYELTEAQRQRFAEIFKQAGPMAEKHWHQVMALLSEQIEF